MESCKCIEFKIPARLHKGERQVDNCFDGSELLYRRFTPFDTNGMSQINPDGSVCASVFTTRSMSCNRGKYSDDPEDVLLNGKDGGHYHDQCIVSFPVEKVKEFTEPHPNDSSVIFTFTLQHVPEECMYPHMEIIVDKSGVQVKEMKKPDIVKFIMKTHFTKIAKVVKR